MPAWVAGCAGEAAGHPWPSSAGGWGLSAGSRREPAPRISRAGWAQGAGEARTSWRGTERRGHGGDARGSGRAAPARSAPFRRSAVSFTGSSSLRPRQLAAGSVRPGAFGGQPRRRAEGPRQARAVRRCGPTRWPSHGQTTDRTGDRRNGGPRQRGEWGEHHGADRKLTPRAGVLARVRRSWQVPAAPADAVQGR